MYAVIRDILRGRTSQMALTKSAQAFGGEWFGSPSATRKKFEKVQRAGDVGKPLIRNMTCVPKGPFWEHRAWLPTKNGGPITESKFRLKRSGRPVTGRLASRFSV